MTKVKRNKFHDNSKNIEDIKEYEKPRGAKELSPEVQARLNRMMSEPLIVAVMVAKPSTVYVGKDNTEVLVTGLLMGSHGFYGVDTGFPNKYQVAIDEFIEVKNIQYVDPITVKLTISTLHAKPGKYDISFANSLGETLTGLNLLKVINQNKDS